MAISDKEVRYRASTLASKRGISYDEALAIAEAELTESAQALKSARKNVYAQNGRAAQKRSNANKKRKKSPIYTSDGAIVGSVVGGGAPSLGKKR